MLDFMHSPPHCVWLLLVPQDFLKLLSPTEVFACENGTVYFQQEENFFLALGECRSYSCTLDSKTGKSPEPAIK